MIGAGALKDLREANRTRVVDALRQSGIASRADIARATGLSPATVSTLVADLLARGIVLETGPNGPSAPGAGGGRPPVLLSLDAGAGVAVGIAFGHARVRVAVGDLSSRVLAERTAQLDVDGAAIAALDAAADLVDEAIEMAGVDRTRAFAAGVGLPGPVDRRIGRLGSTALMHGWTGVDPRAELEQRLRMPVAVDNDAHLGALAEAGLCNGADAEDLIYVLLSEGVGAGFILGGRLHYGASGFAGEIGHIQVQPGGIRCRCGKWGCLETVASVPAVLRRLGADGSEVGLGDAIASGAMDTDLARAILTDAGRALGQILAALCNAVNPAAVVLGGELAAVGDALLAGVREAMPQRLSAEASAARVSVGALGDRAALVGALALVVRDTDRLTTAGLPAFTTPLDPGGSSFL